MASDNSDYKFTDEQRQANALSARGNASPERKHTPLPIRPHIRALDAQTRAARARSVALSDAVYDAHREAKPAEAQRQPPLGFRDKRLENR